MKTTLLNDSNARQTAIKKGQAKIVKNRFLQWPDDYFSIQCAFQDKTGNIWFGSTADGVYYYDGVSFTNFTRNNGLCHNDVLCILEDKTGNIWFGTRGGLCRYKQSSDKSGKKKFTNIPISAGAFANNFVWSIMQDNSGKIWIGTNEGVYFYDPALDLKDFPTFKPFLNDRVINENNLKLKVVQKIIEDKKGNIWFASGDFDGEGICYFDGKTIVNFKPDSITSFRSILETKNGDLLFFATKQGAYRYDGKTFLNFTEKTELKNEPITAALEDNQGNIWLGTYNNDIEKKSHGGAWCFNGNSLKEYTAKDGLSDIGVFCIMQDTDGNIWFGTRNTGLCRYDGKTFTDYTDK